MNRKMLCCYNLTFKSETRRDRDKGTLIFRLYSKKNVNGQRRRNQQIIEGGTTHTLRGPEACVLREIF